MEELFLCLLAPADELDIVNQEYIHIAILLTEFLHGVMAERCYEIIGIGFRADVDGL